MSCPSISIWSRLPLRKISISIDLPSCGDEGDCVRAATRERRLLRRALRAYRVARNEVLKADALVSTESNGAVVGNLVRRMGQGPSRSSGHKTACNNTTPRQEPPPKVSHRTLTPLMLRMTSLMASLAKLGLSLSTLATRMPVRSSLRLSTFCRVGFSQRS